MFCLRNWIGLLVFLTNASPLYVLLFLTGTYFLQRPCVYCSILLFVLIFSLFDFHANWFEPRWPTASASTAALSESASSLLSGNGTLKEVLGETASFAVSAINGTGGSVAATTVEGVKRRVLNGSMGCGAQASGWEWLRGLLEKRQIRIPCVDVIVRL